MQHHFRALLNARLKLLYRHTDSALQYLRDAQNFLNELGHTTSPQSAETFAILAQAHCLSGAVPQGSGYLNQAVSYWLEIAKSDVGAAEMRRIASACDS